jgi:hypothetical protein
MRSANLSSSSTLETPTEEDVMKTKLFTLLLSVAFLSAGAFAHSNHITHNLADGGSSTFYKTQG